jgi:hypothetical protein
MEPGCSFPLSNATPDGLGMEGPARPRQIGDGQWPAIEGVDAENRVTPCDLGIFADQARELQVKAARRQF